MSFFSDLILGIIAGLVVIFLNNVAGFETTVLCMLGVFYYVFLKIRLRGDLK